MVKEHTSASREVNENHYMWFPRKLAASLSSSLFLPSCLDPGGGFAAAIVQPWGNQEAVIICWPSACWQIPMWSCRRNKIPVCLSYYLILLWDYLLLFTIGHKPVVDIAKTYLYKLWPGNPESKNYITLLYLCPVLDLPLISVLFSKKEWPLTPSLLDWKCRILSMLYDSRDFKLHGQTPPTHIAN